MTVAATCAIDQAPSHSAVTGSYEYDAFGNSFTVSGSTPNNYLYRGEQFDSDLGLYYLRARYYNPATGRFMSRDPNDSQLIDGNGIPTDPKYLHKYLYANGDPIDGIDPNGHLNVMTWARIAFVTTTAIIVATVASYAICVVHSANDLSQAIQTLSSSRNPFAAARCAWELLESVMNVPFTHWPWHF